MTPKAVGFFIMPPVAYQSMLKDGTLGGLREKLPLTRGCGIARCGRLHEKLKKPLIWFIALLTASRAEFIRLRIVSRILPKRPPVMLFIAS